MRIWESDRIVHRRRARHTLSNTFALGCHTSSLPSRAMDVEAHAGLAAATGQAHTATLGSTENRLSALAGNRLGLLFYFDNNFVGDRSPAAEELRALHEGGWIDLARTDTVDTELGDTKDPTKRDELLTESSAYIESLGPAVFDHSRFDACVIGNDDDEARLDRVYRLLFPGSDRHAAGTNRARRKLRDAMHIATAIRYGANAFVTRDADDLLSKAAAIGEAFDGFRIMAPEEALAFALMTSRVVVEK